MSQRRGMCPASKRNGYLTPMDIKLPDGAVKHFDAPVSVADIAASIGPGLAKAALAGRVDGKLVDTSHVVDRDARVAIVTERRELLICIRFITGYPAHS